jgi:NAD(P)-dependent dehydrogenase (short-subunit alcohol dehydrogenase family)
MNQPPKVDGSPHLQAAVVQGASRGIGLALAQRLAEQYGVKQIFATCRDPEGAGALTRLAEFHRGRLQVLALDVLDEDSISSAAASVRAQVERLDLLINCAGLLHEPDGVQPERRLSEVDAGAFIKSVRVNTLGPLLVAKHFEPLFRSSGRAVFASISARVGSIGDNRLGGWYAYRASKAAQNMVTRNLSIELRRRARDIICVALHPGTVDSGLSKPFQSRVPEGKLFTASEAAEKLLGVIDGLNGSSNGGFYAWDGTQIPW